MERDQEGAMNKVLMDNNVSRYRTFVVLSFWLPLQASLSHHLRWPRPRFSGLRQGHLERHSGHLERNSR